MKKLSLLVLAFSFFFLSFANKVFAQEACNGATTGVGVTLPIYTSGMTHEITFDMSNLNDNFNYYVKTKTVNSPSDYCQTGNFRIEDGEAGSNRGCSWQIKGKTLYLTIKSKDALIPHWDMNLDGEHSVILYRHQGGSNALCTIGHYFTPKSRLSGQCKFKINQERNGDQCFLDEDASCLEINNTINFSVSGLEENGEPFNGRVRFVIGATGGDVVVDPLAKAFNGSAHETFNPDTATYHTIKVQSIELGHNHDFPNCEVGFHTSETCGTDPEDCAPEVEIVPGSGTSTNPITIGPDKFSLCDQIPEAQAQQRQDCLDCAKGGDDDRAGIWTAIGCIKREPQAIVSRFIKLGLGIGGGFALLSFLAAGFIYSTSQGSPDKIKNAKEMMTASIVGLLFVIFSVTILQFIGYSIFKIPGFGG